MSKSTKSSKCTDRYGSLSLFRSLGFFSFHGFTDYFPLFVPFLSTFLLEIIYDRHRRFYLKAGNYFI